MTADGCVYVSDTEYINNKFGPHAQPPPTTAFAVDAASREVRRGTHAHPVPSVDGDASVGAPTARSPPTGDGPVPGPWSALVTGARGHADAFAVDPRVRRVLWGAGS